MTNPALPQAAQDYFEQALDGTSGNPSYGGIESIIQVFKLEIGSLITGDDDFDPDLIDFEALLATAPKSYVASYVEGLRFWEDKLFRISLLKEDSRMNEVYSLLTKELRSKRQWYAFFNSALRADHDYNADRKSMEEAKLLISDIAKAATKLDALLTKLARIGIVNLPRELFSLRHLLQLDDISTAAWTEKRRHILGDDFSRHPQLNESNNNLDPIDELTKDDRDNWIRSQLYSNRHFSGGDATEIDRAWAEAPMLSTIFAALSKKAIQFKPTLEGMVGATMVSRKKIKKTQYLRGFGYLLSQEYDLPANTNIMKAMSIVATVILDDPAIDVTYDDTRKALEHLKLPGT